MKRNNKIQTKNKVVHKKTSAQNMQKNKIQNGFKNKITKAPKDIKTTKTQKSQKPRNDINHPNISQKSQFKNNANKDKAYKILALQKNISHNVAKNLIDSGLVLLNNKRIAVARMDVDIHSKFDIINNESSVIFEDSNIIAIDKNIGTNSYELEKKYHARLINRLDKDTSGVILLAKNDDFLKRAKIEFKNQNVIKKYYALVNGKIKQDEMTINDKILTTKINGHAISKISKNGIVSTSILKVLRIINNMTLVEVLIKTGRTHQIRVHLSHAGYPIIGDIVYNQCNTKISNRLYLHAFYTKIFDYEFYSKVDFDKIIDFK